MAPRSPKRAVTGHALDRVFVEGVEFLGRHGVTGRERKVGHRCRADVVLELDTRQACKTDNVKFDHGAPVVLDPPPSVKFPFKLEVAGPKASTGVVVTEAAKGKTIKVKEGQDLTLALPGNPTTGYQWKVISTDRTFGYPTEKFSPGGPGVGSGGTSQFVWKTKNGPLSMVGKHQVTLEYARPFGARTPDTKTFSFTVDVVK